MEEGHSPFVIGILAGLGASPAVLLPRLKDRRFVTVARQNLPIFKRQVSARYASLDEATWTGIEYLVDSVADNPEVKVKVLELSARELLRDLQRAPEPNQSALYKKTYEEGRGTFGGEPFACLVADWSLALQSPEHVELLSKLSQIASACWSPLLVELDADVPEDSPAWPWFRRSNDASFLFPLAPRTEVQPPSMVCCNPAYQIAAAAAKAPDALQNIIPASQFGVQRPSITLARLLFLGTLMTQSRTQLRIRTQSGSLDLTHLSNTKFTWDEGQPTPP